VKHSEVTRWRLKKTLARRVEFRRMHDEDLRYTWAAYKKGALEPMANPFGDTDMSAEEFKAAFADALLTRYHAEWTMLADTPKGFLPVGLVLAFHSHPVVEFSPFMVIGDIIWFPWASRRNKIESAVNFFNRMRNEIPMIDYAHGETNKRFFEVLASHGVVRRIGTTFNVVKGEPVAVFETRAK
jgi:hypothetical protein